MDGLTTAQSAAVPDLFALFRRNGMWFCPALTDTPRPVPILPTDPRLKFFPPAQRKIWIEGGTIPPALRAIYWMARRGGGYLGELADSVAGAPA